MAIPTDLIGYTAATLTTTTLSALYALRPFRRSET